jgi:4-diphosphocytidyl-2-C-methyl-D-erythritol kinase
MLIDWADRLHMERRPNGQLSREDLSTPLPADDLILRAARALQTASGTPWGAHIAIDKQLPAQAGMGGGSSDAATTLLALNRLWELDWPLERLLPLGLALGADVPFFLRGHNAWVEGIGERIQPISLPAGQFAVVKPDQGLETALIFRDPALERDCKTATMEDFAASPIGFGHNVLQPVAQRMCPAVTDALQWLMSQGLSPRMTGSGSAVFAPCPADWVMKALPAGWQGRVCSNLNHHPLAGWASGTSYR